VTGLRPPGGKGAAAGLAFQAAGLGLPQGVAPALQFTGARRWLLPVALLG